MIKQIICLTLSLTVGVMPLTGTQFKLNPGPDISIILKTTDGNDIAVCTSLAFGGLLCTYIGLYTGDTKQRNNFGHIVYTANKRSYMLSLFGCLELLLGLGCIAASEWERYKLYKWNHRTNQEVYDDAEATYRHVVKETAPFHLLAHEWINGTTIERKDYIEGLFANTGSSPLTTATTMRHLINDHLQGVKERLEKDTSLTNNTLWTTLKENMEQELSQIDSSYSVFYSIEQNRQKLLQK
ncbi:hypothetical protein H0X48_06720 [Candidatus Dependentiae bacterium]|nr:hypothetical protein [Tatlockia sp.]MBA3954983.1 hypothetical protein [Candidatus Dependentiae bacterium]